MGASGLAHIFCCGGLFQDGKVIIKRAGCVKAIKSRLR